MHKIKWGGGIWQYIIFQTHLLQIEFQWKSIIKILISILTFGKIKK